MTRLASYVIRGLDRLRTEPVAVAAFVNAVLYWFLAFGINLSPEQIAATMTVTNAGLALVVRRKVKPVSK